MEDSNPGPAITPTPNLINLKEEFMILQQNDKSENNLVIELNNNILTLSLKEADELSSTYKKSYTLEEIKKISNIFSFHQELSEIYQYLTGMLEEKTLLLKLEENSKKKYLSFFFEIPGTKKKEEVKLFLEKSQLNMEEENNLIKKELINIKKEIKMLKEENHNLKAKLENKVDTNNNKDINNNLEEIINILIEEKLKEKNLSTNLNNNKENNDNNKKLENEILNINKLISIFDKDHQEQFKNIKAQISELNKKIYELQSNDLNNLKTSLTEEIQSLNTFVNEIHNMAQDENQKYYKKINEISCKITLYENQISDIKISQQNEIQSLQTIFNEFNNNNQEEIQNLRFMVEELNNSISFRALDGDKENNISKFINKIKNSSTEYKNKNIQIKLLYDAGRDGRDCNICHSKCNNIPNTFSLITTTKGVKFGFFRSISINGNGNWLPDNKAFFYSFNKNKIYKIKTDKNAIKFDDNYFINTINFSLNGNILNDKFNCPDKNSMNLNFDGFTEEYELNCGEKDFYIKKFEVYQLEFL